MSNRKITPCENQEFLPPQVADSEKAKLDTAQKNVLGTLCFYYLNHSIYASKHDGWFFKDQRIIFDESNLSEAQGKRVILKLILKRLIERVSGTNHKCTRYRLHPGIVNLLPKNPEIEANEPLIGGHYTEDENANEPLEEKRLDESSRDESRIVEENVSFAPLEEDATTHETNWDGILEQWKVDIHNAKTYEELIQSKEVFKSRGQGMPMEYKSKVDDIACGVYGYKLAMLRH